MFRLVRRFMSQRRRLPSNEELQSFARSVKEPISAAQVAPTLKLFRCELFKSLLGMDITCIDESYQSYQGTLNSFSEKNYRTRLTLTGTLPPGLWDFASVQQP